LNGRVFRPGRFVYRQTHAKRIPNKAKGDLTASVSMPYTYPTIWGVVGGGTKRRQQNDIEAALRRWRDDKQHKRSKG
jgi:hypothetical protein